MEYLIQKERVELFAPNLNIEVVATIEGRVQEKQLTDAIVKAVSSQEILQCRIQVDDQGAAYYSKMDLPKIVIEMFHEDWVNVVTAQEKVPFDLKNGEMIRFFVKYQDNGAQLLIIAHHLAGDGLSVTYLFEDIINALNGQQLAYKKMTLYDMNSMPKDSRLNPIMRLMMKKTNKGWKKTGKVFSFEEYQSMFVKYWECHESAIIYDTLETKTVEKIKDLAKKHRITVNSLLTAAFLQAQKEVNEVGITVRLNSKNGELRGNFSTAVSAHYVWDETKDFLENAVILHNNIHKKLDSNKEKYFLMQFLASLEPTLIDATYFAAFAGYDNKVAVSASDMFGYREKGKKNISISNLTKLKLNLVPGEYSLHDITIVPPIAANAVCIIGIMTYNDKMTISFHTESNGKISEEKKVFERALSILNNL